MSTLIYTRDNLSQGQHLIELIQTFVQLQATEKKHKLFAFWGLAGGRLPAPDYKGSINSIYTNIARWIFEDTHDLVLFCLELIPDPDLQNLPSWVPHFSSSPSIEEMYFRKRLRSLEAYDCSRKTRVSFYFDDRGALCLQGLLVDEVVDVTKQAFISGERDTFTSWERDTHAALLRECQEFASNCPTSEQLSDDEFYETLIAGLASGHSGPSRAATPSDIRSCKEMVSRLMSDRKFDEHTNIPPSIPLTHRGACLNRVMFRTKSGKLGLGPPALKKATTSGYFVAVRHLSSLDEF